MATQILSANQSAFVRNDLTTYNDHESAQDSCYGGGSTYTSCALLVKFPSPAAQYDYLPVTRIGLDIFGHCGGTTTIEQTRSRLISYGAIKESFDIETVTWANHPDYKSLSAGTSSKDLPVTHDAYTGFAYPVGGNLANALVFGVRFGFRPYANGYISVQTAKGSNPPKLFVTFSDSAVTPVLLTTSPASGARIPRTQAQSFTAQMTQSDDATIKRLTPVSGKFEYRLKGASSATAAVAAVSGNSLSYIVPANTFFAAEYEYRFTVTDNLGQIASAEWLSFDTRDTTPVATAEAPSGTLCDGAQPITFRWMHSNESGSAQTKADLQKSADGSTWTTLGTVTGAANEYAAPAGTFTSGTWYWRVRTYNLDGAAGEWSAALSFVVVAGPTKPVIVVKDASPRPLINWQTSEQSAYQLQLDDIIDLTEYGSEKTWRCPVYLADGAHTFRVRSQNSYGLWSEWGSATFTVSHNAGGSVVLTVDADHRAELSWSYAGSWTEFVVYRDGIAIAKTTDYSYTDDYSVGTVRYQVRACASDGTYNYSLSNEVTVSVMPETVMLSALGSGEWLFLRLSTAQHRTNTIKASRTFSLTHLSGRKFPEAELAEFCDRSISVSYATDDVAEKAALEALMGSPVCLKTPGGKMVIGILDTLSETESMFYSSYTFAVSQMHYPEEVDLDA